MVNLIADSERKLSVLLSELRGFLLGSGVAN